MIPLQRTPRIQRLRIAAITLCLAGLPWVTGGCTTIKPWQHGALTDPMMQPDRDPLGQGLLDHDYFSRESATGGRGVSGPGCGCN
jgi:hypothetical protein